MDQTSRDIFDRITQLTPEELTPFELDFLFARRTYLGKTKRAEFKAVLDKKAQAVKEAQEA